MFSQQGLAVKEVPMMLVEGPVEPPKLLKLEMPEYKIHGVGDGKLDPRQCFRNLAIVGSQKTWQEWLKRTTLCLARSQLIYRLCTRKTNLKCIEPSDEPHLKCPRLHLYLSPSLPLLPSRRSTIVGLRIVMKQNAQ
ncbi:hypothetical protein LIER_01789 [Lithospermum erythrorhizon]|uniref:Uncharacterized protein n=1 Tax=Lithospermum erythrorhizon TaxID=34254 RepID=A0AAV3NMB4_LITER